MQGWLFMDDTFWQPAQAEALLTSVPLVCCHAKNCHNLQCLTIIAYSVYLRSLYCVMHHFIHMDQSVIFTVTFVIKTTMLVFWCTRLSTIGVRAFPVAASRLWNTLPQNFTLAPSLTGFGEMPEDLSPQSFLPQIPCNAHTVTSWTL